MYIRFYCLSSKIYKESLLVKLAEHDYMKHKIR